MSPRVIPCRSSLALSAPALGDSAGIVLARAAHAGAGSASRRKIHARRSHAGPRASPGPGAAHLSRSAGAHGRSRDAAKLVSPRPSPAAPRRDRRCPPGRRNGSLHRWNARAPPGSLMSPSKATSPGTARARSAPDTVDQRDRAHCAAANRRASRRCQRRSSSPAPGCRGLFGRSTLPSPRRRARSISATVAVGPACCASRPAGAAGRWLHNVGRPCAVGRGAAWNALAAQKVAAAFCWRPAPGGAQSVPFANGYRITLGPSTRATPRPVEIRDKRHHEPARGPFGAAAPPSWRGHQAADIAGGPACRRCPVRSSIRNGLPARRRRRTPPASTANLGRRRRAGQERRSHHLQEAELPGRSSPPSPCAGRPDRLRFAKTAGSSAPSNTVIFIGNALGHRGRNASPPSTPGAPQDGMNVAAAPTTTSRSASGYDNFKSVLEDQKVPVTTETSPRATTSRGHQPRRHHRPAAAPSSCPGQPGLNVPAATA